METSITKITSQDAIVHFYSERGYDPTDVATTWDHYLRGMELHVNSRGETAITEAELLAFMCYLKRCQTPTIPGVHELRVLTTATAVERTLNNLGTDAPEVIESLRLDYSGHDSIDDIADVVIECIRDHVRCVAVTFELNNVLVDGVEIDYPPAVRNAILYTAERLTKPVAVEPF